MEKIYNKLVRDKIPEIIISNGEEPIFTVLSDYEYKKELELKLMEEYNEVINSSGADRLEELADMIEIIKALANTQGKTLNDVIYIADKKALERGGFNNKIYLKKVLKK
ncbi:MAG: phosphoribosyl-ATP pyrophosphohydrolase [Firmicutes bacterium]|nr:phosphoribosyl-ATP pyrophosphohydrolase [Bacillota bacterium]